MALIGLSEPQASPRGWAPFALGFRPFFLLAGLAAVVLLAVWGWAYVGGHMLANYYGFIGWHSHEMVFGYSSAVIAGFLLTAARNWTGIQTLRGVSLALLALLWLLGRLLPFVPSLPPLLVAVVDLIFLPLFAVALLVPLVRARQYKSLLFVVVALVMSVANLLVHLEILGVLRGGVHAGTYLAVDFVLLAIVVMGGRVIPFFTERGLPPGFVHREWVLVERLAPASVVLLALAEAFWPQPSLLAVVAAVAALMNGWRLYGWYTRGIWRVSLLWVLHLGYAWLVVGFALKALAALGLFAPLQALHALTIGAIGGMTLGMMARVALGHTGRNLVAAPVIGWAFALVNAATLVRVFLPLLMPYTQTVAIAATLWVAAFALFSWRYVPILLRARVDGQPG